MVPIVRFAIVGGTPLGPRLDARAIRSTCHAMFDTNTLSDIGVVIGAGGTLTVPLAQQCAQHTERQDYRECTNHNLSVRVFL